MNLQEREQYLAEFQTEFERHAKECGISVSLDDLHHSFSIKDIILREPAIPTNLPRFLTVVIRNFINDWIGFLHGLAMPNPNSMISVAEHQATEKDRAEIISTMNKAFAFSGRATPLLLKNDAKAYAAYINEATAAWNEFAPFCAKLGDELNEYWKKIASEEVKL